MILLKTGNSFLDSLSSDTQIALRPHLISTHLGTGQLLATPDAPVSRLYFPLRSVISTLTIMRNGDSVEVGLTGHEGVSAISLFFGNVVNEHLIIAQVPDGAWSIDAKIFIKRASADPPLYDRLRAYAGYSYSAATQFAACNRLHAAEQRLARWVLMAQDRVMSDEFQLTQDFLGQMLGVRRPSVSQIAGSLSRAGLIRYHRGEMTIVDRKSLKDQACECYDAVNILLARYTGLSINP